MPIRYGLSNNIGLGGQYATWAGTLPPLPSGTLVRYLDELTITGLTSNPTIFDKAIGYLRAEQILDPKPPWSSTVTPTVPG